MKSPDHTPAKILVIAPPDNQDLLCHILAPDYQVLTASKTAREILAVEPGIAVIIYDLRASGINDGELQFIATHYPDVCIVINDDCQNSALLDALASSEIVFKYVSDWQTQLKPVVAQAVDTHNYFKVRTQKLCQQLRRESLLNRVTDTIRSALDYRQILQTIVDTVGKTLDVDYCILRPLQDHHLVEEAFFYQQELQKKLASTSKTLPDADYYQLPITQYHCKLEACPQHPASHLMQTVWEAWEVQVINDVATDERIQKENLARTAAYQAANICSSLIVPLIYQQELMAVLALHQLQPRRWLDADTQLVTMVADRAALALSQARAYERISALAEREALINKITTAIRSSLDPQEIFAAITQKLGQALHVDGCALSLWTEEDEFVQCVGLYNRTESEAFFTPQQLPQSRSPIAGNPVLQMLLKTQQPVVINDLLQQPQMKGFDLPLSSPAARGLLVVPLLADTKSIGSITLRSFHQPRRWSGAEIELAQAVAAQAAIAVQQSRLYQKSRSLAERLLELDHQKTQFFQNISHEFRTPLTLMLAPLESAVMQQQNLPLEQAAIALRNSRRLLRLVNQLLDLQRLDAGRMQPSFRPCDLVDFVRQIVESFRPYCQKKGLELITHLHPCPSVYLDTDKFDKVIFNLLSNAMKFTPAGGKISVTVEPAGDHCLLQVKDTGIGIAKEQIPHLFKRFHQADATTNRSYEGSGLGLALVKELVDLHAGQISVESVDGESSTFTIWLPHGTAHLPLERVIEVPTQVQLRSAAVELADLELLEAQKIESRTQNYEPTIQNLRAPTVPVASNSIILVVDDNLDLRTYVSTILRKLGGYQVYTARNGKQGFDVAKRLSPDLIVTDLMMPQLSGLEMIALIRQDQKLKGVPIVLLTAKTDEETRILGTEHGADAYLAKPFNDRELLAEVRNLLALKANERRVIELNKYLTESVLKRFLPPEMVKKAAAGKLTLDLSPEPLLITILFTDIVGFTQLANTLRSRGIAQLLNTYLEAMIRDVFNNGGTVDKLMGDAILAIFGAPKKISSDKQVRRAIATARAMQKSLAVLNEQWYAQGLLGQDCTSPIQFRCGIHQGTAVVGMFGSAERADYTAIGPSVNIAARLQQAAAPGQILVSAVVADYLAEDEIIKCSPLELRGVDETVLTFSVK